jgi:hypothetical protein
MTCLHPTTWAEIRQAIAQRYPPILTTSAEEGMEDWDEEVRRTPFGR